VVWELLQAINIQDAEFDELHPNPIHGSLVIGVSGQLNVVGHYLTVLVEDALRLSDYHTWKIIFKVKDEMCLVQVPAIQLTSTFRLLMDACTVPQASFQ
jgi:hypothetical protein